MRLADPAQFFAPSDKREGLLQKKSKLLSKHPERHLSSSPEAEPLLGNLTRQLKIWGIAHSYEEGDFTALARHVEPDILLMEQDSQRLVAANVCFPSSWEPARWIVQPLSAIHDVVPRLNPQIGPMIERFLRQLRPGKAYRRANWSLTLGDELNLPPRPPEVAD